MDYRPRTPPWDLPHPGTEPVSPALAGVFFTISTTWEAPDTCMHIDPWRREWQPTPVFLPGESRGQRSLEGYSP